MRGVPVWAVWVGATVWWALGGTSLAASHLEPPPPATVIPADRAQITRMATYRGPHGAPIPVGACGALVNGRVWVLPCGDPRVKAYRQGLDATEQRASHGAGRYEVLGVLLVAAAGGGLAEWWYRRRTGGR